MSQFFLQKKMLMRFTHQHQKVYTQTTTTEAPTEPANPPEPVDPGEEG